MNTQLDPETCLALQPIHDIGAQAIKERDEWSRWAVEIAALLNIPCSNFTSKVVADQYAELRERITKALIGSSDTKWHDFPSKCGIYALLNKGGFISMVHISDLGEGVWHFRSEGHAYWYPFDASLFNGRCYGPIQIPEVPSES